MGEREGWDAWEALAKDWKATNAFFYLGKERTRETWGWAFGQASLDSISVPRTSMPRSFLSPRDLPPSLMAAARFPSHGRKVNLFISLSLALTLTPMRDRRYRSKLPRPCQGIQQPHPERTLLLSQADIILLAVTNTRSKAADPSRRLGSS